MTGRGIWGAPCGGFGGALSLFLRFLVGGVCCVCFGFGCGGCGLASGVVALSSLLCCCVASVVVVVCWRCLPVVAFLCGAGVVGSSVACRWSFLSVGGAAVRGVVVVVAGVGLSALLLGACRSVSVGVVGCVAGGRVACAPSCCCFSALRLRGAGSVAGARSLFLCV